MNRTSCLVIFFLWGLSANAATPPPTVPLEAYGRLPTVSSMAISPNGDRIAFRRADASVDAVVVMELSSGEVIGIVDGSETKVRDVSFLDQDRVLLYAAESAHIRLIGNRLQVSGSFVYDLQRNKLAKLLQKSRHLYPLQSGVGRIVGHDPDSDTVYMPAYVGELNSTPATYGLLGVTMDDPDGALITRGRSDTQDWFVDNKGNILVEDEYDNTRDLQRIWRHRGGNRVLIYESNQLGGRYGTVGLSHDFSSLIVSARTIGSEYSTYYEMSLEDGSVGQALFQNDDADVEATLVDRNRRVFGVQYAGFYPRYEFFDPALTKRVNAIQASMNTTAAYLVDWTPDFNYLLFRLTGGWTAGSYVLVGPDSLQPRLLANIREDLPGDAVVPTKVISYPARDGMRIPALVTARADVVVAGRAPLIVLPHGGPEAHDVFEFDWLAQYFASRGIVVLQPQFRGSTGFGATLRKAGKGQWGAAMSTDLDDGVQRLIEDGLVDPERVCMVGMSYGGYAALAAGAFSKFAYKCLVSVAGVSDLPHMLKAERTLFGHSSDTVEYWQEQFGSRGKADKVMGEVSPVNYAENFRAPVLLVHGRDDSIVPYDQSARMEKALRRAKKTVELVKLKGEDHYLSGNDSRLEALRIMAKFIEDNL